MKPICAPCQRFYRPKKNAVFFVESMPIGSAQAPPGTSHPELWTPYKIWCGDLWECQGCGAQLISGVGMEPVSEHYKDDFTGWMEKTGAHKFIVNDC